jgi:hypothetical protein
LLVVPTGRVAACDCALTALGEAVAAADVAVVGTLVSQVGPAPRQDGQPVEHMWTWAVERSRDPIEQGELTILAWMDDGANCGVSFGTNERWLVVAHLEGGHLRTNGCLPNRRLVGDDPEVEAVVEAMIPTSESATPGTPDAFSLPPQVIPIVLGAGAIGVVSLWAFRRERAR